MWNSQDKIEAVLTISIKSNIITEQVNQSRWNLDSDRFKVFLYITSWHSLTYTTVRVSIRTLLQKVGRHYSTKFSDILVWAEADWHGFFYLFTLCTFPHVWWKGVLVFFHHLELVLTFGPFEGVLHLTLNLLVLSTFSFSILLFFK